MATACRSTIYSGAGTRELTKIKQKRKRLVALAQQVASIVEVLVADGAADEQLAGRVLHKYYARAALGNTLPNLRLVVRDKPHSARRLLQRTLTKYLYISKLMATIDLASRVLGQARAALAPASGDIPVPSSAAHGQGGGHFEELGLRRALC